LSPLPVLCISTTIACPLQSEAFRAEADYDHKQGASIASGKDNLAEFTQKLGAGFRKTLPDEELQMQQAKSHATEATARQVDLFGKEYLQAGVINCCPEIIGIKAGSTPITYTPMPRFRDGDQKLALLNASRWGEKDSAKPSRIIEPIAGIIDSKAVEKAISSGRFQLQLCFELSLRRNQTAKGSMEWQWKIDTQGKISSLSLLNSTMKDDELIRCVRQRIAGWKFPKARGGSVEIRYPFEFVRDRG